MARMIPEAVGDDAAPGEIAVFEAIASHPGTESWTVMHSLRIARHDYQVEGEADFVVIIPHIGVLVIEVKSHTSLSYGDGVWRLGGDAPTRRSPFAQAADNMYSIKSFLQARTDLLEFVPMWRVVWFTGIAREELAQLSDRVDVRREDLLGKEDLDPRALPGAIQRVLTTFAADHRKGSTYVDQFTPTYARHLAELLLPAMRVGAEPRIRPADERERSIEAATEQQSLIVRMLGEAPRIIIDGGAGSGKTHVATRVARRAANRDNRVLLTMFNIYLEEHLQQVMHDSGVTVRRIHAEMMRISGLEPPEDADSEWWNTTLPTAALERMRLDTWEPPYDFIVIDEAQDLVSKLTLDVLDGLVAGGLEHGSVWAAGDFQRQGIHHRDTDAKASLRDRFSMRMIGAQPVTLDRNVRSTPELVEFIEQLIDSEYAAEVLRSDAEVRSAQLIRVADDDEMDETLPAAVQLLREEGWLDDEILILSPRRIGAAQRCSNPRLAELLSDSNELGTGIRAGTIHKFKGLEAPAVILTDVSTESESDLNLLYVGATRATDRLIVLTTDVGG